MRRLRIALAVPLVREGRPRWLRALGRRIAPAASVGDGSCGGCNSCGSAPPRKRLATARWWAEAARATMSSCARQAIRRRSVATDRPQCLRAALRRPPHVAASAPLRPPGVKRALLAGDASRPRRPPGARSRRRGRCGWSAPPSIPRRRRRAGGGSCPRPAAGVDCAAPCAVDRGIDRSAGGAGTTGQTLALSRIVVLQCGQVRVAPAVPGRARAHDAALSSRPALPALPLALAPLPCSSQPNSTWPRMREPAATVSEPALRSPISTPDFEQLDARARIRCCLRVRRR